MTELNFQIAYGAFCAALIAALLLVLARALRGTNYWRFVFCGFGLGILFMFFGLGIFSVLVAGILTGYLFGREVQSWKKLVCAGSMVSVLLVIDSLFVMVYYGFKEVALKYGYSLVDFSGRFFAEMVAETSISIFILIAFAGLGAILGGWLRKALKPAELKPTTVAG
jgi:4-amino-4-deoxy-L-arabinose transferase-like glycosyltransferase